jgi:hypothetical protein
MQRLGGLTLNMEESEAIKAIVGKRDEAVGYEIVCIRDVWCEDCKAIHFEFRPSMLLL